MSSEPSKILVFGQIDSQESYNNAILKANKLNGGNNGPFSLLVLFAQSSDFLDSDFINDSSMPDLPVYMLVNSVDDSSDLKYITDFESRNDEEVSVLLDGKLTILKSAFGALKTKSGITVGWFGSNGNIRAPNQDKSPFHDAVKLFKKSAPVDILLTRLYPNHITKNTSVDSDTASFINRCQDTTIVTRSALPRYHFVSYSRDPYRVPRLEDDLENPSVFWERQPYYSPVSLFNSEENAEADEESVYTVSRFISLAPFSLSSMKGPPVTTKALIRYHYLFVLRRPRPEATSLNDILKPGSTTASATTTPFNDEKRRANQQEGPNKRQRLDSDRRRQVLDVSPESCFLCLSNPTIATHLIVSVAEESYVALARGPLLTPGGRHVLIVPLAHLATLGKEQDTESEAARQNRENISKEQERYIQALVKTYFDDNELSSELVVTFEISRRKNVHIHTQAVALPTGDYKDLVSTFEKCSESFRYPEFQTFSEEDKESTDSAEFLRITIYSKKKVNLDNSRPVPVVVLKLDLDDDTIRFNLQYPRKAIAEFLLSQNKGSEDTSDWRQCVQSEDDEEKAAKQLKRLMSKHDFT